MKHSSVTVTRYRIFLYVFYLFLTTFKIDIIWNNKSEIALLCLYVDFSTFYLIIGFCHVLRRILKHN